MDNLNTTTETILVTALAAATPARIKQVKTILRGAKKLVTASGLVRYTDALNKYRKPVSATNPNAVRFGLFGALVYTAKRTKAANDSLDLAVEVLGQEINNASVGYAFRLDPTATVQGFADWRAGTVSDVTNMLDRAIAFFA